MKVEKSIRKSVEELNNASCNLSYSMAKRYAYDFIFLNQLLEKYGLDDFKNNFNLSDYDDGNSLLNYIDIYLTELERLADRVIKLFKNNNFYCYLNRGYASISNKDKNDIFREFLEYFMSDLVNLYRDLYDNNQIFLADLDMDMGETFLLRQIDKYYIAFNSHFHNDLFDIETAIHELLHVYVAKFLKNYAWQNSVNITNGLSSEAVSLYSELSFFEFMKERHIYTEDMLFHRNLLDYFILQYFKTIKYFAHFAKHPENEVIFPNGVEYVFSKKHVYNKDKGVPFFQYHEDDLYKESLNDFLYGIGSIEAHELLKKEKMGYDIKKSINEFLLAQYDPEYVDKKVFNSDITYMGERIKDTQKRLEKIRPIPGYNVKKS